MSLFGGQLVSGIQLPWPAMRPNYAVVSVMEILGSWHMTVTLCVMESEGHILYIMHT